MYWNAITHAIGFVVGARINKTLKLNKDIKENTNPFQTEQRKNIYTLFTTFSFFKNIRKLFKKYFFISFEVNIC